MNQDALKEKDRVYYRMKTHLEMLHDRSRCLAYQKAVESVVQDKIVLDVGCGSGILSFFAARAGARRVFAVDMDIPPGIQEVTQANNLADRIEFFTGKIQDIELPVDSVDVIVSEWMGGILLMEDMLPAVLYARDRWLKPGGCLLPHRARLFLAPLNDVAGLSSNHFPGLRETISTQMWVSIIDPSRFLAEPACILDLDLNMVREPDVRSYETTFHFELNKAGTLNGFGFWFDVFLGRTGPPQVLSTAPWLPPTHWGQGLWILPGDIEVHKDDEVSGSFAQTKISPSTASFKANVFLRGETKNITVRDRIIEANPSNMNTAGSNEEDISIDAMSGAYLGKECFWVGCSMSFAALMVARNGAASLTIVNHSPWAVRAMQQLADQEGLTNVRFLSEVPPPGQLQHRDICLLGTSDSSWQALVSHIKVRRALGRASVSLRFYREQSPWEQFYGFDFSAYAPYDLEMYHEDMPFGNGIELKDITAPSGSAKKRKPNTPEGDKPDEEIIYKGAASGSSHISINLHDGSYNSTKVNFYCGTVVLPLQKVLLIDAKTNRQLEKVELTISILQAAICRFSLILTGPGWSLQQDYEQPMTAMGHIVRNQ